MMCPLKTLHNLIVLSEDPDAKYSPFLENTKLSTELEWPRKAFISSPLDTLHNLIYISSDPDAKYCPSSENTTLHILSEWPWMVLISFASLIPKYILYAALKKLSCPLSLSFYFLSPPPIDSSPFLIIIISISSFFFSFSSITFLISISNSLSFFCIYSRRGLRILVLL